MWMRLSPSYGARSRDGESRCRSRLSSRTPVAVEGDDLVERGAGGGPRRRGRVVRVDERGRLESRRSGVDADHLGVAEHAVAPQGERLRAGPQRPDVAVGVAGAHRVVDDVRARELLADADLDRLAAGAVERAAAARRRPCGRSRRSSACRPVLTIATGARRRCSTFAAGVPVRPWIAVLRAWRRTRRQSSKAGGVEAGRVLARVDVLDRRDVVAACRCCRPAAARPRPRAPSRTCRC